MVFVARMSIEGVYCFSPIQSTKSRTVSAQIEHETRLRSSYGTPEPSITSFTLDPKDTAFVFIEYQNEFTTPGGKLHDAVKDVMAQTNMLENSSRVLNAARNAGCTIIHCPISFDPVGSFSFHVYQCFRCSSLLTNHLTLFLILRATTKSKLIPTVFWLV